MSIQAEIIETFAVRRYAAPEQIGAALQAAMLTPHSMQSTLQPDDLINLDGIGVYGSVQEAADYLDGIGDGEVPGGAERLLAIMQAARRSMEATDPADYQERLASGLVVYKACREYVERHVLLTRLAPTQARPFIPVVAVTRLDIASAPDPLLRQSFALTPGGRVPERHRPARKSVFAAWTGRRVLLGLRK